MVEKFKTIAGASSGEYKEKGSKFIAHAFPVENEDEVKERLDELRKKYYDARHHCYAFVLHADRSRYRSNDDGEPSHSAGDPILGQINSFELTNILVVVVRYFGGTKLGVGGLITAYKTASEEALKQAVITEETVRKEFRLEYPYESTNEIMRLTAEMDIKILEQNFAIACELKGAVIITQQDILREKVKLLQDLGNNIMINFL
ncbi:MAG: IMPACT family protein [Candidatus Cyclobacteriaceae bacterium M2_1C_046]